MQTGEIIKKLRIEKKLTQDELGEMLGVKKSAIQKYESGTITNLKMDCIQGLCNIFDVPPWIFIFSEKLIVDDSMSINEIINGEYSKRMNVNFYLLNDEGKRKVLEYTIDLLNSGNYKIDNN